MRQNLKRRLAMLLSIGLASVGLTALSAPANAAEIEGAITNVYIEEETLFEWSQFKVNIDWAVPDGSSGGDTFTMTLPEEMYALADTFELRTPEGDLVATAVISSEGVVTFTLTDYVETHANVSGTAFFESKFRPDMVEEGETNVFIFETDTDTFYEDGVDVGVGENERVEPQKFGYWTDVVDQGESNPQGAIQWRIYSSKGAHQEVVFDDELGPGHALDCDDPDIDAGPNDGILVELVLGFEDPSGDPTGVEPLDPSLYTIESCDADGFRVVAGPVGEGQGVRVSYSSTITDPTVAPFSNTATVSEDGTDWVREGEVEYSESGGDADGDEMPDIDIEKWSTVDGPVDGDYDSAAKPLEPYVDEEITFTIENIGFEPLIDVVVSDTTQEGDPIEDLTCDFSELGGLAAGVEWDGPFEPGAIFECTGVVPGMAPGTTHTDTAAVSGTGQASGVTVDDDDPWNGTPPPAEPSIDIEKWSTVDGATDGDYDEGPGKVLQPFTAEDITFTITNTGNEALLDVVVTDTTTDGPAVEDLDCTFPDGSTGTEWAGPFVVGATFECTATLPGMEAGLLHSDTATVTGVGEISGEPVEDEDEWHGGTTVLGQFETFPPEETPAPPVATPDVPELPNTGSDALGLVGLSVAALLAGLFTVVAVRRKTTH